MPRHDLVGVSGVASFDGLTSDRPASSRVGAYAKWAAQADLRYAEGTTSKATWLDEIGFLPPILQRGGKPIGSVYYYAAAVQIRIDGGLRNSLADLRKAP